MLPEDIPAPTEDLHVVTAPTSCVLNLRGRGSEGQGVREGEEGKWTPGESGDIVPSLFSFDGSNLCVLMRVCEYNRETGTERGSNQLFD